MCKNIIYLLLLTSALISFLPGADAADTNIGNKLPKEILSKVYIPELDLTELILQNGMKVILKPTAFETDEVLVRMTSLGGYSLLPPEKYASGVIAPQVALESGLDNLTSDQLCVLLYKHFIELNVKIQPFSRIIEGSTDTDGIPTILKLIQMLFTKPRFDRDSFNTVVKQTGESLLKRSNDRDTNFDDIFKKTNTQDYVYLEPLTKEALEKADFATVKSFFEYSFSNPAEFICIIVGDFEIKDNLEGIADTLGAIKKKTVTANYVQPTYPKFPKGIIKKSVKVSGRSDSLVRLTFPLSSPLEQSQLQPFEVAGEVLESRLRDDFREKFKSSLGISVAYEFPLYPLQYRPWFVIQYRCNPKLVGAVQEIILKDLKKLREEGPSKAELEKVLSNIKRTDEFWLRENNYWLITLSNYYTWDWDPKKIIKSFDHIAKLTPEDIKKIFIDFVPLDNYTLIYFQP